MTFAARYRAVTVLVAITIATALIHLLSVGIGAAVVFVVVGVLLILDGVRG